MTLNVAKLAAIGAASSALLLAIACSSSNNNNKNTNSSANASVVASPTTIASTAPTPIATVPTASPSIPPPPSPPPIPPLRTATPLVSAGTATTGTATTGAALQQQLASAALTASDLPSGFNATAGPNTNTPLPGQTAGYQQVFTKIAPPDAVVLVDGLQGYGDVASAQAAMKDLQNGLQQLNQSLGLSLTSVAAPVQLGDETQAYKVTMSFQGFTLNGYMLAWRHGRLSATLIDAGTGGTAPASPNDVAPIAQKQDAKLQAVTQ